MVDTPHSVRPRLGGFVLTRVSQGEQPVIPPPVPGTSPVPLDSRPHKHSGEEWDL